MGLHQSKISRVRTKPIDIDPFEFDLDNRNDQLHVARLLELTRVLKMPKKTPDTILQAMEENDLKPLARMIFLRNLKKGRLRQIVLSVIQHTPNLTAHKGLEALEKAQVGSTIDIGLLNEACMSAIKETVRETGLKESQILNA